ncbi:hypothetical protein BY10_22460 [Escherichia coli O104:H4 str. 2011EL-1675A]|nr:hypothetical protein BY10_22460 [Escherichia coli O104:H4 str. 2011EL-1675A]EZG63501.1 hypothetical protein BX78_17380 [Escherichia coli O26:H11 str. 2010C-4819]
MWANDFSYCLKLLFFSLGAPLFLAESAVFLKQFRTRLRLQLIHHSLSLRLFVQFIQQLAGSFPAMSCGCVTLCCHIRISILLQKLLAIHALHGFTLLRHRINRFWLRGCVVLLHGFSITHGGFFCGLTSATISGNRTEWSPHRSTKGSTFDRCVSHALPWRYIHSGGLTQCRVFLIA